MYWGREFKVGGNKGKNPRWECGWSFWEDEMEQRKKKTKEIFLNKKSKQQKAQLKFNYEVIESNLGMYGLELHACVSTF